MHSKQQLAEMKSEHDDWQDRLRFYRDEIKQFNNYLSKIAVSSPPSDIMPSVEHFQNQFIRQKEVLDIIRHDFKQHENLIEALAENKIQDNGKDLIKKHALEREKLDQYERIFHDLRNEFNNFLNQVPA